VSLSKTDANNLMRQFIECGVENILAFNGEVGEGDALQFVTSLFGFLVNANEQEEQALTLYQAALLVSQAYPGTTASEQWVVGGSAADEPVFPQCFGNGGE